MLWLVMVAFRAVEHRLRRALVNDAGISEPNNCCSLTTVLLVSSLCIYHNHVSIGLRPTTTHAGDGGIGARYRDPPLHGLEQAVETMCRIFVLIIILSASALRPTSTQAEKHREHAG